MKRAICVPLVCVLVALVRGHVKIKKVTDAYGLTEGPHWDHRTQKLYFVDIYNQYIRRLDPATGVVNSAYIDHGPVGIVVPVDDTIDQFAVGSARDVIHVTWDITFSNTSYHVLYSVDNGRNETRINDGKVDSSGRLWLGTMDDEQITGEVHPNHGTLYRVDELKPKAVVSPVTISNGLAWNIEDDTFYYIDSPTREVAAYNYDPNSGAISNKRIVFNLNNTNLQGVPDGMTIDTEGNLWIALYGGHHVIKVDPKTGNLLRKVKIPADNVTSVAFGGPLLDTLYVTTSGRGLTQEQRNATPDAGAVFAVTGLGVRGILANSLMMNGLVDV